MDQALDVILDKAKARIGSLMLMDPETHALRIVAARGFSQETMDWIKKLTLAPGQGVAGHVYQTGKPYYMRDPKEDALFLDADIPLASNCQFLSLPVRDSEGNTVGVLNIHFPTENLLDSKELEELSNLANRLTTRLIQSVTLSEAKGL